MGKQVFCFSPFLLFLLFCSVCGLQYQTLHISREEQNNISSNNNNNNNIINNNNGEEELVKQGLWQIRILHRDSVDPVPAVNQNQTFALMLQRDSARVESLNARLEAAIANKPVAEVRSPQASDFSTPVSSGLSQGSGEYFAQVAIGTPPRPTSLVIDTGSDLSWLQCLPCESCYKQSDPVFDPASSSSYKKVACSAPTCAKLDVSSCQTDSCLYQVSYGDGSFTVGELSTETLTFDAAALPSIAVGCGHQNEGLFVGAAGLLGLGSGALSFPSQVSSQIEGQFSYCLADRDSSASGSIVFGAGSVAAADSTFASLVSNPKMSTFYYVPLTGISVGGSQLSIPRGDFSLNMIGSGGVIIDTGTAVTRLISSAYTITRDAFRAGTKSLPPAEPFALFDTCFNLAGLQFVDVPTLELNFEGGAKMTLPAKNYLIPVDTAGTYCFAFAPTTGSLSIIGNLQQQGFRISFNTATAKVGFSPAQC